MPGEPKLPYLSAEDRLKAYQLITSGCHHLWSKNKFQTDKALKIIEELVKLGYSDPYFLAHFTSYVMKKDSKDLKVMSIYANSLSSANGMPFSAKSSYKKPNLRYVSAAAVQLLPPKLVLRLLEIERLKYSVENLLNQGRHFPNVLRTALKKYLLYRENNLAIVRGIKKAGMGRMYVSVHKMLHVAPNEAVAGILRWKQKGKDIKFEDSVFDFKGKSSKQIAEKIRKDKLPVLGVLGALPEITPVIAVALLEQATGEQAVILRKTFEDAGILDDKEVMKLYSEKIATAKNALDRVKSFVEDASKEVKEELKKAKSVKRKEATAGLGKIYIHLDMSPSMEPALEVAKEKGALIAETVDNPKENFNWGYFNDTAKILPKPETFEEDAFKSILFGRRCTGMTDASLSYPLARQCKADIDVYISDGCHNMGDLNAKIRQYHEAHPEHPKPKAMLWVFVKSQGVGYSEEEKDNIKKAYEENEIPVATITPKTLSESSLIIDAVREAMKGPMATIEAVMDTPLLGLPDWYFSL